MKHLQLIIMLLLLPLNLLASESGTTEYPKYNTSSNFFNSNSYEVLHVGVPLIAAGLILKPSAEKFQDLRNNFCGTTAHTAVDDYTQYAPAAVMLSLKAAGVESRSSWGRMLTSDAFSVGIATLAVNGVKRTAKVKRPDSNATNSFPSGHTTTAFMTATMLHKEYGARSPWYSILGYTTATATGLMRVVNNRHWVSDILAGAGLGIISTELGYLIADAAFKDRGLNKEYDKKSAPTWTEVDKRGSIGIYLGVVNPIADGSSADNLSIETGSKVGVEGAYYFNDFWGVGANIGITTSSINIGRELQDEQLNIISTDVGCYFNYCLLPRIRVGTKLAAGLDYYEELSCKDNIYIPKGARAALETSLSVEYLSSRHYSLKAFCDYDASFQPHLPSSNLYQSLTLGISSNIIF